MKVECHCTKIFSPPETKESYADNHFVRLGQGVYFHLNHPIRFVSLTAVIVAVEDVASKYALLTLDDGSGANIIVKITRLPPEIARSAECPSNTSLDNVNLHMDVGTFDVVVDGQAIDVGSVVKVKCTIDEWKGTKQLQLKRIRVVMSTEEEIRSWEELARWKRDVIGAPWVLESETLRNLEQEDRDERKKKWEKDRVMEEKRKAYVAKRKEREARHKAHEEKWERRRRKEEIIMNTGAFI